MTFNRPFALALLAILALGILFHASALRGWWLNDDPQVLLHAVRNSPADALWNPVKWRELSSSNFTPLVTLSFDFDLLVAGMSARSFYRHQVLAILLAAVLLLILLRRHVDPLLAAIMTAAFVVAPMTVMAARSLMIRHYVEGLCLALGSLILFEKGTEKPDQRLKYDISSALLYLLAILGKEVFYPLPLLFLMQARGSGQPWKVVIRRLVPATVVALIALLWRRAMLGSVGGYGGSIETSELLRIPQSVASFIVGPVPLAVTIVLAVVALVVLAVSVRTDRGRTLAMILALFFIALLPLIPVAGAIEPRYAFVPSVITISAIGLALESVRRSKPGSEDTRRNIALGGAALVFIILFVRGQKVRVEFDPLYRVMVAEGRYVWREGENAPTLLAGSQGWYLSGLSDLREHQGRGKGPAFVLSQYALSLPDRDVSNVVAFSADAGTIAPVAPEVLQAAQADRQKFVRDTPLMVEMSRKGNDLSWTLGPSGPATWIFLSYPEGDEYPIEEKGWIRIPETRELQRFWIRRTLPDGSWTISPPLLLPPHDGTVRWSGRKGEGPK